MLLALDFFTDAPVEVVLAWPEGEAPPADLVDVLRHTFLPNRALAGAAEGGASAALAGVAPIAAGKVAAGGHATAYVCEHGSCRAPVSDAAGLLAQLATVKPL
jgi:uncharacterized protein YyaL (SSP411 family)